MGQGIDQAPRWSLAFFEVDLEVVWLMRSKGISMLFAEDIGKVVIFRQNAVEVDFFGTFANLAQMRLSSRFRINTSDPSSFATHWKVA